MIKIIPPDAWPDARDGAQLEVVKSSAYGLRGRDLADFVKRASHPLAMWVRDNPPKQGEVYVHNIALTSTKRAGCNRNADGYTDEMMRRDYDTFEKHARWYYNHRNNDPAKSYGVCKKAVYLPDLNRVDVITALNATKEAAARNGGLVDTKTLDKLASNVDVAVSQSCRVPIDVCMSCGNKAKNRSEYCGPERCKYGGCRDNLGRVFDDGFHLYVDNPRCTFFDLSNVSDTRGADRTAFVTGKVAAADRTVGGAELAEMLGLVAPDHLLDRDTLGAVACLRKLASFRYPVSAAAPTWDDIVAVRGRRAKAADFGPTPEAVHDAVADMAAAGVVLPPAAWLACATGVARDKCASPFRGGCAPADLLGRPDAHDILSETAPPGPADSRVSAAWAWLSPTPRAHAAETALGVISGAGRAKAAAGPHDGEIKARYLAYQGRVLAAHAGSPGFDLLLAECARHNLGLTV